MTFLASKFDLPHGAWMSACPAMSSPSTRPSLVTTAAPVSSQLLSIPKSILGRVTVSWGLAAAESRRQARVGMFLGQAARHVQQDGNAAANLAWPQRPFFCMNTDS